MTPNFRLKAALLLGVCPSGFLSAAPLLAQDGAGVASGSTVQDEGEQAQESSPATSPEGGIVVSAQRLRGQLNVEQAPILELDAEAIAAEGAASIADLITQISAQTGTSRGRGGGRPIILVNGVRIGSFREFRQYPPEALARVEVFSEEVALRFGFSPDQRVVNLILKENFRNLEVEFEFEGPSRGGYHQREQELGYLQIADGGRINLNLQLNDTSDLTEDERDIIQTAGSDSSIDGDPSQARFRTLVGDSRGIEVSANWAKAFVSSGLSLSGNVTYERSDETNLQGLNIVELADSSVRTFGEETPLTTTLSSDTFSSSGSLTKPLGAFRLTTTFDAGLAESEQFIDQRFDESGFNINALPSAINPGQDRVNARNISASTLTTLDGPIVQLPAGEVLMTLDLGYDWTNLQSEDTRGNQPVDLIRGDLTAGLNLVVPLSSAGGDGLLDALGGLTLNAQVGVQHLSDFGTLSDFNLSLDWQLFDSLGLSATYIQREVAPGLGALGNPQVTSLNVPVFDFTRGETVLASVTSGGNPNLLAETQRDWKFSAYWDLPFWEGAALTADYVRNRSNDVTSGFPALTPEIEAAFPDRITRDASGRLTALDRRAVTFEETRADRLTLGMFVRGRIGGEERGRGGPPPQARPQPAAAGGGDRADRMAAFRKIACAPDGDAQMRALIARIAAGEDVSDVLPGFDPARAAPMLNRLRGEDGEFSPERFARLQDRLCSAQAAPGATGQGGQQGGSNAPFGGRNPFDRGSRPGFRYFLSLSHTIELKNTILIAPGLAPLDQLDGQSTNRFGLPRHSTRLEAGIFGQGVGTRLSARYTGKTRLDGASGAGGTQSSTLFFDDLARFDLRIFANMGQLFGKDEGWLKNLRLSFRVDNVFDAQRRVVDANGVTPTAYQPFLIDPTGRFVGVEIRKLF